MYKNIVSGKIQWAVMAMLFILSCKKDLGNYKYNEINESIISGIDTAYVINAGDRLKVSPLITYSKDQSPDTLNYKYEWFKGEPVGSTGFDPILMSSKLNIDTLINLDLGRYEMYFKVTDKKTGIYSLKNFRLAVINKAYEGWLVLADVNGQSRLDMLDTYGGRYRKYINILDTMKSDLKLTGSPVAIGTSRSNYIGGGALFINYVVTKAAGYAFHYNSMKAQPLHDFTNTLPDKSISDFSGSRFNFATYLECLYTQGNVYLKINSGSYDPFINRKQDGLRFNAAAFYATKNSVFDPVTILYNEDEQKFYRYPGSGNTSFPLNIEGISTKNQELLYMTYSLYNGGEVFAVLRNPQMAKTYLLRFSLAGSLIYYNEITGTDISNAVLFAVSPVYGYLFYNVGSKVYEYDFGLKSSALMLDLGDETISLIRFHRFIRGKRGDYPDIEKQLILGSNKQSSSGTSGKLSFYDVPSLNKGLVLKNSFEGFGKIVDVTYKER